MSLCLWLQPTVNLAQTTIPLASTALYNPDRILVQPKPGVSLNRMAQLHSTLGSRVSHEFEKIGRLQIVSVRRGQSVEKLIDHYQQSGLVEYAEPDFAIRIATVPNDPKFVDGTLWGLHNIGQDGGTIDADIDAPEAWDVRTSASNIVVAILDTGIRYSHEDLATNVWTSPNDGGHGWNALTGTNDPADDHGHGTIMAGVLGAAGNNGKGITGVAWQIQLMGCKCISSSGIGFESDLISCIDFARTNGARVVNASLDSTGYSQALSNAIFSLRDAGIIFVASAGNNSQDIDVTPHYPAALNIDNVVSVAYTTRTDSLGFLSNYGATNVDLAAPGDQIYSTWSPSDSSYYPPFSFNVAGTSYAAACVSGSFALMLARYPGETHQQTISRVLNATDPLPSLAGKCVTGGRLNLRKALSPPISLMPLAPTGDGSIPFRVTAGPHRVCVIEGSTNLINWTPFFTNTTGASGTFDFTNGPSANSLFRLFRAVSSL
jgi:subtilisin family serine protease